MHLTGLYAALCTLIVLALAGLVSLRRRSARIALGDGGDATLHRRVRAHANAIENVPLALILLLILELDQTAPALLHTFGVALVVARVLHGFGLVRRAGPSLGRMAGTAITWTLLLAMSALLLWRFVLRLAI